MSSLEHHGIKGQRWGVRRFQNKDGSRTAEGKKRYKTIQAVHGAYKEPNYAEKEQHAYDDASKRVFDAVAKADQALQDRFKETDLGKKNPNAIPHIDGYTTGDISSPFSKSIEKQIYDWIRKQDDLREPIREAEEIRSKAESRLRKKVEHTSMGGSMNYIYGNTLVLGDSSYLEHHGIKGQRWGLRRFQNSDGSLTDAGRKRYGIVSGAKKAAGMVGAGAKKTFDAGKKAATVIKAHREKAAEEKKAKLKEKASKSRLGVLANKDLFTADEMRKLNERFKIEDEMKMASLKKGADIVSNIATIARGVRDVNSAVEEITGKTINPFKKSKNEADLRKAEAQAKKAEAAADKERSEADKAARDNTKDAESKAKQEKESAAKEKEAATEKKASDNANKEIDDIKADTAKKAADISSKYDSPKKDGPKGLPEHTPAPKAKENEELSRTVKDIASKLDSGRMVLGRDKQAESGVSNTPKLPGPTVKDHFNADSPAFKQLSAAISAANANKQSNVKAPKAKNIDVPDEYKPGAKKPKSNEELSKSLNELAKMAAKNLDIAKDKKSDPSSTNSKILEKNKKTLDNLKSDDGLANAIGGILKPKEKRPANKAKIEALSKKVKNTKDPKLREKYIKDLANEATRLDIDDFEKFANGTLFKHSALSSDELAHYGVLGMKWGKHIMAGKGLLPKLESSGGGGGGAPEEEEEDEENKIDPNYSRDKNKLPGKKHLDKATEYANKAAADRAKAQAEEAKMHKAQAEAASLNRKVKGASFWNDSDGYFVSKQRPADKKRVKQLRAEAKEHRQASKRYASSAGSNAAKSGKEYKKWIKTPSGLYDNAMRHDFIVEDGTLYLEHHGILGQKWGVRRFQNKDGSRTAEGKKRYKTLKTASAKKAKFETPFGKAKNKAIDKAKEDRLNMVDDIRYGKNKSKYDDAVDEYDKATMHRYDEYEKESDKYAAIAGMAGARRWWNDQSDDALRDGAEFYMYDDGDQSKYNSYDYFLVGKGENPNEVHGRLHNATNKIMDLAKADAKEALGEYGNTKEANDFALNIFEYATAASPYSMVNESDGLTYSNDEIAEMRRDIDVYTKEAKRLGLIHMDLTVSEGALYLEHHGIKGQRWGVRRFQNDDGTLTDKGRKHYQKKLDREKRKQVSSDNLRGTLERQHGLAVGASGVLSAITGALTVAAIVSNPATIAAGAAIAAAVSAGITHGTYSVAEAWEGRGSRIRKKRIAKYENMLKQDAFIVEDGTLYLEHFGIKNMKWGVRRFQNKDGSLTDAGKKRYGSGEELSSGGGGGGGAPEEDEEMKKKIEEAAKKAGMTVDEYRKKMGSKLYDLFGGKYKKEAEDLRKRQLESSKNARLLEKEGGKKNEDADSERVNAKVYGHYAKEANKSYEKSIAGRYDKLKATMAERGKAKKKEASEQKRKGRTDQYIAGPEQNKNTKHLLDTEYSKSLRRGAERKSRDAAIFGKAADELKRKQSSALGKGLKAKADYYGKQVDFIEKTSSEKIMGQRDWKGNLRDSEPYTSVRDSKRAYDKTAQGKLDKARYAVQRTKQRVKNTLEARGSSQIPTKNSSPDQSPTNRPVSREKTKRAVKGSIKVGERRHRSTTSQQGIKQGEKHEGLRTHTLPKMKSLTATAKPMRKLTSKELSKIRSEARIKQLKKDGDYTGEYKKKRRK